MKRRTLDILFSIGGVGLAALLLILGLVMTNRADFAKSYVRDELKAQDIQFTALAKLDPREKAYSQARTGCAIQWAGQFVTTGRQAECYANEVIGGHLTWLATRSQMPQVAYVDGMSYRELGVEQGKIKTDIAAAQAANDQPKVTALKQKLADVTTVRDKVFQGTMLRNALLTSYGFSSLGETAGKVASVAYTVAGILLLLAIAGFVHALFTPRSKAFALPEPTNGKTAAKELAGVS